MSGSSTRPSKLSRQELDLLIRRLGDKKRPVDKTVEETIPRLPRTDFPCRFPASFPQQRLWLLDQLHPGSATYNIAGVVELSGELQMAALEEAFRQLVARHEVLRTTFEVAEEDADTTPQPMQVIAEEVVIECTVVDLPGPSRVARRQQAAAAAEAESRLPFDLRQGPLLRIKLLRLADREYHLLVVVHHIIADGWSLGILLQELVAFYGAAVEGRPASLPALAVQYADVSQWQRQRLQGEILERDLQYWRQQLADVPLLELPTDHPRPAQPQQLGRRWPVEVPPTLAATLRRLAQAQGTTLFVVLQTAFAVLLARLSGQSRLTVGMPVAGRRRKEMEGLIGFFVNTVVLCHDLETDESFIDLLAKTKELVLAADAHQEVPFEKLVEELSPERHLATTPFFQVAMAFEAATLGTMRAGDVEWRTRELETGTAKFDLTLNLADRAAGAHGGKLEGSIEYDVELFDRSTIGRWWGHLGILLEALSAEPTTAWNRLPLLSESARHQLTVVWNGKPETFATPLATLPSLVARQASLGPERPAVVDGEGGETLTYGELEARANRLAHYLRAAGAGPERIVAVCMERSVELVVALLAVLKSGAAYLPLDLAYPTERLAFMLEDSGAEWLLSEADLRSRLPEMTGQILCLDDESVRREVAAQPATAPETGIDGDHLAYVIYTSGSTGQPKGVLIPHRRVARLLAACDDWFSFDHRDCWTFFHSHAFDFSVWEIWGALATGGRLVVVPYWVSRSPEAFYDLLREQKVTVLNQTPSAFRQLVDVARRSPHQDLALREVIFGGEALDLTTLQPWFQRFGDHTPRLVNMYGITETTVHVTYRPLVAADAGTSGRSPVGRAIPDLTLHIVDRHGQVQPVGVAGEMWVGGAGSARGYLGRPALTAERFIPDPFSGEPGARLYRSGDLARYLPDGDIDFLGRIDHQVKIRGFRIELGEIEACLQGLEGVAEAAVLVQTILNEPQLVGYWVPSKAAETEEELSNANLRLALGQRLPDYMIPAFYVMLETLPLTANGKLDRRALPLPEMEDATAEYVAPSSATEIALAEIWAQTLGLEQVGVHDDFFALGGHSLLATQITARLRQKLAIEVPLRLLFEAPTVSGLASLIDNMALEEVSPDQVSPEALLVARQDDGLAALTFAQERLWFLEQLDPGNPAYNISAVLSLRGTLDVDAFRQSLSQIVARHGALRTVFRIVDGEARQIVQAATTVDLPLDDLSHLAAAEALEEASRRAYAEASSPFNLGQGPLLRVRLLRLAENDHQLILNMHHMVSDGWSVGILLQELVALYDAALKGSPSPLEPLALQYVDVAEWQRQYLSDEALAPGLDFWRQRLTDVPILELPTDRPRPAMAKQRGSVLSVHLDADLATALGQLAASQGVTLYMLLLAAFGTLLSRLTQQQDVTVGSPVANRRRVEMESLIGLFVNTVVQRLDLAGSPSFTELLGRVREVVLASDAHQDVPFEKVVAAVEGERQLSTNPLFQAMLVLQNAPFSRMSLPGLEIVPLPVDSGTSKFDLTLAMGESLVGSGGGLDGHLEYDIDLFDAVTIERWWGHFRTLLQGILEKPSRPLWQLPMLSTAQRRQLLVEWNVIDGFEVPTSAAAATVTDLFAAQVARTPEAPALYHQGMVWSYSELAARVWHLARRLQGLGIGPDRVVGVCLDRRPEMIVAMLAAQAAGGAYVPLDPNYPSQRLGYILEDTAAPVVLTRRALVDVLPAHGGTVICLDEEPPESTPTTAPAHGAGWENLAHLIYTSGSTGRPKGVAIAHRSSVILMHWARQAFSGEELAGMLAATSINFDLSVFEILVPLSWGGAVILAENALELPTLPDRERVRLVNTVPSAMAELVRQEGIPSCVQTVNLAGEPLRRALVDGIYASASVAGVYNLYGPSEDTTYSTYTRVPSDTPAEPIIGRPLVSTQAYVLGPHGEPVAQGVVGELYLGGEGLARGYLGRSAMTAERFVPDHLGATPGARLYRTGDLVRYLPSSEMLFLGRVDHQVKIRGFRIELGEIESALLAQAGVRDAVVLARQDREGDPRLVAYLTGEGLEAEVLRREISTSLPEYMLPAAFVMLPELPLLPNGKVNRKALPAPEWQGDADAYVAPRNDTEAELASIWQEVLGVERLGVHDNFFALGGHSLLATQVMTRIRRHLNVELAMRHLFEAPTVAELADKVLAAGATELLPMTSEDRDELTEVSFAQERLWFLDQLNPGDSTYNLLALESLRGILDEAVLRDALSEVVQRHEALRTVFRETPEGVRQVVQEARPIELPITDLRHLPLADRSEAAAAWARQEASRPFDLRRGPLFRAGLVRLDEDEHWLLLNMHHIVSDGWSIGILVGELSALYNAFLKGEASPLPPLPVQYADYVRWQRRMMSGDRLAEQLGYWRQQLQQLPVLELPTDRPRPLESRHQGAILPVRIGAEVHDRLGRLARRWGVTRYMVLLASYGALLSRLTGELDVAIGMPVANRRLARIEGLIGFFVNTLVARLDLSGRPSFETLVDRCRQVVLEADAHQDTPFDKVVTEVQRGHRADEQALFRTLLVLQGGPGKADMGGLTTQTVPLDNGTAKFDLSLMLAAPGPEDDGSAAGLEGIFEYDVDLFDGATIERWRGAWLTLLEGMLEAPDRPFQDVPLLRPDVLEQLTTDWAVRKVEYPAAQGLADLFRQQAGQRPDSQAVLFETSAGEVERLSYQQLDERSDRLAGHLVSAGLRGEELVGLCADRSLEMIIATLGILKAGGAYLPLDPTYPPERISWMLQDGGVRHLLVQESLQGLLPGDHGAQLHVLDGAHATWYQASIPAAGVLPRSTGGHLAYLMYTSGSTGRPKGVAVEQHSVSRLVRGSRFGDFSSDRTFLGFAPISFDAATLEIWGPLLNGGRLVLAPPHELSLEELATVIETHGVDSLWLTAGLFHQMALHGPLERLSSLRQWFAGGDVLSPEAVAKALEALPDCTLINGYGPTENTTFTTCHGMRQGDDVGQQVSIGRPIENTGVQILDASFFPQPVGVFGQLCASGEGLARGYHRQPALTAERFVPDPLADTPGRRIYLTGDRARYLADGRLEFQGRIDRQLKMRGYRIEPGEIESALVAQPEVRQAAVMVQDEAQGKRLLAFVVLAEELPAVDRSLESMLLDRLAGSLPTYMVPSALLILEALPLNANGKVDRHALSELAVGAAVHGGDEVHVEPRNPTEKLLAELWCEVLDLEQVSVESDFFDLGGHSLLATQLVSRMRHACKVDLPLRQLFRHPTVASLALEVEKLQADQGPMAAEVPRFDRTQDLALSFAQERLWLLDRFEPGNPAYNMPFSLRLDGPLDVAILRSSMEHLMARHESLRTTYADAGGLPVQHVAERLDFELTSTDLSALQGTAQQEALDELTRKQANASFDLARGPVFRVHLVRLDGQRHILQFIVHHIASDGWSMGILTRDLGILYAALASGQEPELPPLPLRYVEYAQWQRDWLQGERLEKQLSYWRQQLADLPVGLELPTDRPRPVVRSFVGDQQNLHLDVQLREALNLLARRHGATLFMVLLAAFEVLLSRLSGQTDLAVGMPIAGRQRQEVENLVGIFLNTLVLRGDLSGQPSFEALLQRVRETTLSAYAHQDLPFEKLLDALRPERDMARTPFFQVFFNMVNMPLKPLRLPGLEISPMGQPEASAKFDLTIYAQEVDGGLRFEWVFNQRLFDGERIGEMMRQYEGLLRQVVQTPQRAVDELYLLTPQARTLLPDPCQELDNSWQGAVHELMAAQAEQYPDKVAVRSARGAWTYRQLDEQSNRLAHWLRSVGVRSEDRVGILAHRSASLVWAVQGALKSGGAFVLFDPAYPAAHLSKTLERAEPKAWLQLSDAGNLPAEVQAQLETMGCPRLTLAPWHEIDDDGGPGPLAEQPTTAPQVDISPDDLAYISFTSGSTGIPKGILGRHGPLTHFLPWQSQHFGLVPEDRYSMLSGLAHDPLQRDMFTPLCLGATLSIPEPRRIFTAGYLAEWMVEEGITVAHMTPAMAQVLTEPPASGEAPAVESLRLACLTGDVLTQRDVVRLRRLAPKVRCVNFYGSTETQRAVGFQEAPVDLGNDGKQIMPLGRGMKDVQLLVVNAAGQLAGIGELGEVWVRSPHLARGYLGDPELTADRFLTNSFRPLAADGTPDRVYRTGDLGRYQVDGTVVFAGRADHQVKIRGFRIELGEIEGQLAALDGVREAVVQVRGSESGAGDRRLLALVVRDPRSEFEVKAATLRDSLRQRLPEYMVPAGFVFLDSLPLTPNGKLDRHALAQIEDSDREIQMAFKAPRTEMEMALADILKEVLEIDKVGADDNFFDLGGNSLLLVKFHNRIQQIVERDIQAVEIFNHPTVSALAAYITSSSDGSVPEETVVEDRSEQLKSGRNRLKARLAKRRR